MLVSPPPTPWDLRFPFGTIPVRVNPLFWVLALVLGWDTVNLGLEYLLVWVVCVFVSILVHELGHAASFLYFGARPEIVLFSFGGLAIPDRPLRSRTQNIVTLLAGPGAGFVLLAIVLMSQYFFQWAITNDLTLYLFGFLRDINLYWGVLNLLPVWPLDGGQIARELCQKYRRHDGISLSLKISIGLGGTLAVVSLMGSNGMFPGLFQAIPFLPRTIFGTMMFGVLAFQSWQALEQLNSWRDRPPWR